MSYDYIILYLFSVTETGTINLLLGNNNCSCVNIQCLGSLYAVVSNPDLEDALCPVYTLGSTCYSPSFCGQFQGTPFFRICENRSESDGLGCTYSMCFGNITEQLNGTKLDFFVLTRTLCQAASTIYLTRTYIRSFEIKGDKLSQGRIQWEGLGGQFSPPSSPSAVSFPFNTIDL